MKNSHDKELLILGLLFLAFFNKGTLATPNPGMTPDPTRAPPDPTKGPSTDPSGGKSSSPGENDQPMDPTGANTRNGPGNDVSNMPGGGNAGVPDKSKTMAPPGGMAGMMATFMAPSTADMINPKGPGGMYMMIGPGAYFVPGLDMYGNPTGGPGPGAYTPSITTRYGDKTFTNFDPSLFNSPPKNPGMSMPEMMKQMPPMMIPQVIYNDPTTIQRGPLIPVDLSQLPMPRPVPTYQIIPMMMPMPKPVPIQNFPGSSYVPNPLPPANDFFSMLFQQGTSFGQAALNKLLQGGQTGFGLIGNLFGTPSGPLIRPIDVMIG